IDRAALPDPDVDEPIADDAYIAPRTPTEAVLARIWAEVLGVSRVGVMDDFFALGGHSLLAFQIIGRGREQLHADLPLDTLFDRPTIAHFAEALTAQVQ